MRVRGVPPDPLASPPRSTGQGRTTRWRPGRGCRGPARHGCRTHRAAHVRAGMRSRRGNRTSCSICQELGLLQGRLVRPSLFSNHPVTTVCDHLWACGVLMSIWPLPSHSCIATPTRTIAIDTGTGGHDTEFLGGEQPRAEAPRRTEGSSLLPDSHSTAHLLRSPQSKSASFPRTVLCDPER